METRKIGGLEVSVAGLGCIDFGWRIDARETVKVVEAALDAGINFFDTADIYGKGLSEEFLGCALGRRRDDVLIATKFGLDMGDERKGAQPAYVQEAVEASLRRLGTDRIDLYNCTALIRRRQLQIRSGLCKSSLGKAKCAKSAPPIFLSIKSVRRLRPGRTDQISSACKMSSVSSSARRCRTFCRNAPHAVSLSCLTFHSRAGC